MIWKTSLVVTALVGTLVSFGTARSETLEEQGWKPVPNISGDTLFHYKPKTLKPTSDGSIGVWIRREPAMNKLGLDPVMVSFDEYDCKNQKVRRTAGKVYQKGFDPQDVQPEPWTELKKGSNNADVLEFVCREVKKP
ncbi:MAG: hypothetical protein HYS23_05410 [Geobacter sp.]|nr:hypothetical protein [Geobacter sp.]